jgi:hypothetical protein
MQPPTGAGLALMEIKDSFTTHAKRLIGVKH